MTPEDSASSPAMASSTPAPIILERNSQPCRDNLTRHPFHPSGPPHGGGELLGVSPCVPRRTLVASVHSSVTDRRGHWRRAALRRVPPEQLLRPLHDHVPPPRSLGRSAAVRRRRHNAGGAE